VSIWETAAKVKEKKFHFSDTGAICQRNHGNVSGLKLAASKDGH
jgi:hypothetical protein